MANAVLFAKLDITHKLNAMIILFVILVFIYGIGEVFKDQEEAKVSIRRWR